MTTGQIPFTPRAKKVLECALQEVIAIQPPPAFVDTEHILLGLVRAADGVAGEILRELHADPERIRAEVLRALGH